MNIKSTFSMPYNGLLWLCLVVALLLSGCQFKGQKPYAPEAQVTLDNPWRPEPMAMRIYPSTRFSKSGNQWIVEARIELMDAMGDSIKSSGQIHFELRSTGSISGSEQTQDFYKWDITLKTLEDQQVAYDPVSRAYLFRLKLGKNQPPAVATTLFATFFRADGQRFDAKAALPKARQD